MQRFAVSLSERVRKFVFVPAIFAVIALLFLNIVDRFVQNGALGISRVEELSIIIMIWLVFLSVFAVDQDDSHIKVQILNLPDRVQECLEDIAVVLFVGFLVWSTWALLPIMFSKYAALGWSIKVGYFAIAVGGSVTILAKIGRLRRADRAAQPRRCRGEILGFRRLYADGVHAPEFRAVLVMGFFIEAVPIMLIFVPLMLPAARGLGIDSIHYGVTFSMIILLANLTPPVGVQTLFVCRLLDTTVFEWWRHGKYFFFVILLVTFVVMFVPAIPLWLPGAIMN